jgi:hypothetical protein
VADSNGTARWSGESSLPPPQYIRAEQVMDAMASFGRHRLRTLSPLRVLVLAMLAGSFITFGGLLATLLAAGIETPGLAVLVEGIGFSAGFFFIVLAEAVLFTEANVVLPATLLETGGPGARSVRSGPRVDRQPRRGHHHRPADRRRPDLSRARPRRPR